MLPTFKEIYQDYDKIDDLQKYKDWFNRSYLSCDRCGCLLFRWELFFSTEYLQGNYFTVETQMEDDVLSCSSKDSKTLEICRPCYMTIVLDIDSFPLNMNLEDKLITAVKNFREYNAIDLKTTSGYGSGFFDHQKWRANNSIEDLIISPDYSSVNLRHPALHHHFKNCLLKSNDIYLPFTEFYIVSARYIKDSLVALIDIQYPVRKGDLKDHISGLDYISDICYGSVSCFNCSIIPCKEDLYKHSYNEQDVKEMITVFHQEEQSYRQIRVDKVLHLLDANLLENDIYTVKRSFVEILDVSSDIS